MWSFRSLNGGELIREYPLFELKRGNNNKIENKNLYFYELEDEYVGYMSRYDIKLFTKRYKIENLKENK